MRIVNKSEFVKTPRGTVFTTWSPLSCERDGKLLIKTGHVEKCNIELQDYKETFYMYNGECELIPSPACDSIEQLLSGQDLDFVDYVCQYDGSPNDYDDDQLFMIFNDEELDSIVEAIQYAKELQGKPKLLLRDTAEWIMTSDINWGDSGQYFAYFKCSNCDEGIKLYAYYNSRTKKYKVFNIPYCCECGSGMHVKETELIEEY